MVTRTIGLKRPGGTESSRRAVSFSTGNSGRWMAGDGRLASLGDLSAGGGVGGERQN